jgi:hypothetical protein
MVKGKHMKGILEGTGLVIDRFLGVEQFGSTTPHYKHKQSCLHISEKPLPELDSLALLEELYRIIEDNWQRSRNHYRKPPSQENWRVMRCPEIAEQNTSPEVTLERSIIKATEEHWVNQVPTSSGLTGPRYDKVRNIDLVHNLAHGVWELIELKVNSDTPLYAAMEILQYGLLFLFSRRHQQELQYDTSKELLQATQIHLKVLAPSRYYISNRAGAPYQLQWLEESLNEGLQQFVDGSQQAPLQMDFQFEAFSPDFIWPTANGGSDPDDLRTALRDRHPVYAHRALTAPAR